MDTITHKCPNCGGALTFEPTDQQFHCPYCMSTFTADELTAFEEQQKEAHLPDAKLDSATANQAAADAKSGTAQLDEMELFLCPSCGAEIVTDATTAATYCYYCHNPVVLQGRLSGDFLPDKVLPFAISKEEATKQFLTWAAKKRFVPKAFFNQSQVEKLTGVYFPYWEVDAQATGELQGTGTSLRVWRVGDLEYTETKKFAIERSGKMNFRNLIKNALSKNIQQKMVEGVQPFPIDQAVTFKNQYLAGFQAEKRDIEYDTLQAAIQSELADYGENLLKDTVGSFTTFKIKHKQFDLTEETKAYCLLPVWIVTYQGERQDKRTYYYAMNGQTGKVSGILPISYQKLSLVAGGIFLLVLIACLLGGYFL
ncbi:MAG: TFIIB-type zinc ribbon-containing protein [Enterococcus sp.]